MTGEGPHYGQGVVEGVDQQGGGGAGAPCDREVFVERGLAGVAFGKRVVGWGSVVTVESVRGLAQGPQVVGQVLGRGEPQHGFACHLGHFTSFYAVRYPACQ